MTLTEYMTQQYELCLWDVYGCRTYFDETPARALVTPLFARRIRGLAMHVRRTVPSVFRLKRECDTLCVYVFVRLEANNSVSMYPLVAEWANNSFNFSYVTPYKRRNSVLSKTCCENFTSLVHAPLRYGPLSVKRILRWRIEPL